MDREQALFRLFGKYCPEGTILYPQGTWGDEMHFVLSGGVRIGQQRPGAVPGPVLGPGEIVGEEAFLSRASRRRGAEIVRESRLIQVSDRTMEAVARQAPETARRILERFCSLGAGARRDLEAWRLSHAARRSGLLLRDAGGGVRIEDLVEQCGVAAADAELLLGRLESGGALARSGAEYRVADAGALAGMLRDLTAGDA